MELSITSECASRELLMHMAQAQAQTQAQAQAQAQDTHFTAQEQAAFNEVIQLLETSLDTAAPTGIVNLGFTPDANDIPAKREKLAILVSTGKSKEAIGVQRSNACQTRTWKSTAKGKKPTSAARQPSP